MFCRNGIVISWQEKKTLYNFVLERIKHKYLYINPRDKNICLLNVHISRFINFSLLKPIDNIY